MGGGSDESEVAERHMKRMGEKKLNWKAELAQGRCVAEVAVHCNGHPCASKDTDTAVDFAERVIRMKLNTHGLLFSTSSNPAFLLRKFESQSLTQRSAILMVFKDTSAHLIR